MSAIQWARSLFRSISDKRLGSKSAPRRFAIGKRERPDPRQEAIAEKRICYYSATSPEDIIKLSANESLRCRSQISVGLADSGQCGRRCGNASFPVRERLWPGFRSSLAPAPDTVDCL